MRFGARKRIGVVMLAATLLGLFGCGRTQGPQSSRDRPPPVSVVEEDGVWWFNSSAEEHLFVVGAELSEGPEASDVAELWTEQTLSEVLGGGFNTISPTVQIPKETFVDDLRVVSWPNSGSFDPPFAEDLVNPDDFYPDLFDEVFYGEARWQARVTSAFGRGAANLIGRSLGDSPSWAEPTDGKAHPWVEALLCRDEESVAKRRWVGLLRSRYDSAQAAGSVYGVVDRTWEEFAVRTEWPEAADEAAARTDGHLFLELIATRWYELRIGSLKDYDNGRVLALSDRINGPDAPAWLYPVLGQWVDVIYVVWPAGTPGRDAKLLEIHEGTGKPILVGASAASGAEYAEDVRRLAELPFVVGRIEEGPAPSEVELVEAANNQAQERHSSSGLSLP